MIKSCLSRRGEGATAPLRPCDSWDSGAAPGRGRGTTIAAQAPAGAVVVHGVPLLVERGQAGSGDLVVVVEAAPEARVGRLVGGGLSEEDGRARIAAQATDEQRRAVADVVVD